MTQIATSSHAIVAFHTIQFHPQSAPVYAILIAAAFFIGIFLLCQILQKLPGRNLQLLITIGLFPVSACISRIFDPVPYMGALASIAGSLSGDMLQFSLIILLILGILFLNLIVMVLPWALAVLLPVFLFYPTLNEPGLGKVAGICAAFTLLAGAGIHLLILFTPFAWLSVFSFDPAPVTMPETAVLCGGLLVTCLLASAGYYLIRKLKKIMYRSCGRCGQGNG